MEEYLLRNTVEKLYEGEGSPIDGRYDTLSVKLVFLLEKTNEFYANVNFCGRYEDNDYTITGRILKIYNDEESSNIQKIELQQTESVKHLNNVKGSKTVRKEDSKKYTTKINDEVFEWPFLSEYVKKVDGLVLKRVDLTDKYVMKSEMNGGKIYVIDKNVQDLEKEINTPFTPLSVSSGILELDDMEFFDSDEEEKSEEGKQVDEESKDKNVENEIDSGLRKCVD